MMAARITAAAPMATLETIGKSPSPEVSPTPAAMMVSRAPDVVAIRPSEVSLRARSAAASAAAAAGSGEGADAGAPRGTVADRGPAGQGAALGLLGEVLPQAPPRPVRQLGVFKAGAEVVIAYAALVPPG